MNNYFIFRGLSIEQEVQDTLNERVSRHSERVAQDSEFPFDFKNDAFFPKQSLIEKGFPNGGWPSENHAILAHALHRVSPFKRNYQDLYKLVQFLMAGV